MNQSKAIRLDEETAARPLDNGQWYIFAYEDDEGEIHEMIRAGHLVLSELACQNFVDAVCSETGGCDILKDAQRDLDVARDIMGYTREEWARMANRLQGELNKTLDERDALLVLCEAVLLHLNEAPLEYRNGITDPTGTFDEGNVIGWRTHNTLVAELATATEK